MVLAITQNLLNLQATPESQQVSTAQREAEKRESREWINKDGVRRWFAAAFVDPRVNASRLKGQVGDELVVSDAVFKMLDTLSGIKIAPFAARQHDVQIGSDKTRGVGNGVLPDDKFAALLCGLEGMVHLGTTAAGKARAEAFLAPFRDISKRLRTYVSRFRVGFMGEFGQMLADNVENAIDRDLLKVGAAAREASDLLRARFPHSPPKGDLDQLDIPSITPASFDHTRQATDELIGAHRYVLLASAAATPGSTGAGRAAPQKQKMAPSTPSADGGGRVHLSASTGPSPRKFALHQEGVPKTCIRWYTSGTCLWGNACRFSHDVKNASGGREFGRSGASGSGSGAWIADPRGGGGWGGGQGAVAPVFGSDEGFGNQGRGGGGHGIFPKKQLGGAGRETASEFVGQRQDNEVQDNEVHRARGSSAAKSSLAERGDG